MEKIFKIVLHFVMLLHVIFAYSFSPKSEILNHAFTILNFEPNTAIKIAEMHINNVTTKEEKFDCYTILITSYRNLGLYDKAFKYAFEASRQIEDLTPSQEFYLALEKSDLLRIIGLVEYSSIFIKQADILKQEHVEIVNDQALQVKYYMERFILAIDHNNFLDAKINYDYLKTKHNKFLFENPNLELIVKTNFVTLLISEGKLNEAEELIQSVLSQYNRKDFKVHPFFHALAYRKLAKVKIQLNQLSNAEIALKRAIELMLPYNNAKVLSGLYYNLGEISLASDKFTDAQNNFQKAKSFDEILDAVEKDSHHVIYNMIEANSKLIIQKYESSQNALFIKVTCLLGVLLLVLLIFLVKYIIKYNYKKKLQMYVDYNKKLDSNILLNASSNSDIEKLNQNLSSAKPEIPSNQNLKTEAKESLEVVAVQEITHSQTKVSIMSKALEEELLSRLKKFEKTNKFLSKDISLGLLASYIDTNTKYLSELIKMHYNCNYNAYINNLRINYIILKLRTDPKFMSYKISYLAEISGFSSHSSFATVFKQITGNTPAVYIDFLKKELNNET